ncbi:MAG TPA: MarR family winged helix-turn-helix transcriptional regulator [Phycicoccus sp.]
MQATTDPRLSEVLSAVFGQMSKAIGRSPGLLTRGDYTVLGLTAALGPRRLCEIADAEGHDPSTTSRRISALVDRGLLERTPDPDDGRAHRVHLTGPGRDLLEAERARRAALVEHALHDWDAADREALTRLLSRLHDTLARTSGRSERTS